MMSTAPVMAGGMVSETRLPGTLQYSVKVPITSGLSGVITELPNAGATIAPGKVLFRVNTYPVVMLSGYLPAWRDFTLAMTRGSDILQLEKNLRTFGFFDSDPDQRFTWDTVLAIKRWQKSLGVEQTGIIKKSTILFADQKLRVDRIKSRVGEQIAAGATVYQSTSRQKIVELNIKSANRQLAVPRAAVTVALPNGDDIKGAIKTVGSPVSQPSRDGTETTVVVPVRITITDQKAVSELALATVSVKFASTLRKDVLTVPVDALVPTDDTHFAVELPRTGPKGERTMIPVTVGAFSSGRVEISGPDIIDGLPVVVPSQ